ncbi:hypothetical protein [Rhizocola hellebori]|uniref:hypothetical protein n=1 Tax=Rhizocola hellebori TaxID=1392758 RepID=UPI001944346B|nr:hypothetical protein [Rhizocola hellebori]
MSVALLIGTAACQSETPAANAADTSTANPASPSPTPSPSVARLHVADLMAKAGCKGTIIGTQLYSFETGRCTLSGVEVTIAAFDTATLRDDWVKAAKQFGGSYVTGQGWAARVEQADTAETLARLLGGKVA